MSRKKKSNITVEDIGGLYLSPDNEIYTLLVYNQILMGSKTNTGTKVGQLEDFKDFVRLIPEKPIEPPKPKRGRPKKILGATKLDTNKQDSDTTSALVDQKIQKRKDKIEKRVKQAEDMAQNKIAVRVPEKKNKHYEVIINGVGTTGLILRDTLKAALEQAKIDPSNWPSDFTEEDIKLAEGILGNENRTNP